MVDNYIQAVIEEVGWREVYHLLVEDERTALEALLVDTLYSCDSVNYDESTHHLTLIARHSRWGLGLIWIWKLFPIPMLKKRWQSKILVTFSKVVSFVLEDEARIGVGEIVYIKATVDEVMITGGFPVVLHIRVCEAPTARVFVVPPGDW